MLDKLRSQILLKAGIEIISPSDCQQIAISINKTINKSISKTTIKRLFGFAIAKNNFSKFTINALLEYAEIDDPIIIESASTYIKKYNADDWKQIYLKAQTISKTTLKTVIKSSTIPYTYTVNRSFAEIDFTNFYSSSSSFAAFIGQPGSGKTILLSHLVQNCFLNAKGKYHTDVILYLAASNILNYAEKRTDLSIEIKQKLGIPGEKRLINAANEHFKQTGHRIIIIIDSFDELFATNTEKNIVFNELIAFLYELEESQAIKLVLGMRSYVWSRFYQLFRNSHYLKNKFHLGNHYEKRDITNIPPLEEKEIDLVLKRIHNQEPKELNPKLRAQFKQPFFFKFYNDIKDYYPQEFYHSDLIFNEIYLRYIELHLYQSEHAAQKLMLCAKLIEWSEHNFNDFEIDKKLLLKDFSVHKQAYMKLLAKGIIIEHKQLTNNSFKETFGFADKHLYIFFLFKYLQETFLNRTKDLLFKHILNYPKPLVLTLLKWFVFIAIKHNEPNLPNMILKLKLTPDDHRYFSDFINENIKYRLKFNPINS